MAQTRTTNRTAEGRIGSGARVRGRIYGDGDLVIEGNVEGDVALRGDLTVAAGASVSSDVVEAFAVTIAGWVEADVRASGPVRLQAGARVRGDVQGSAVTIDDGARFSGRLDCAFDLPPELGGASRGDTRGDTKPRAPARR